MLGHVIPAVGSIAEHYTKAIHLERLRGMCCAQVPLEEVARKPASICDQLKASGFAVVRCNVKRLDADRAISCLDRDGSELPSVLVAFQACRGSGMAGRTVRSQPSRVHV